MESIRFGTWILRCLFFLWISSVVAWTYEDERISERNHKLQELLRTLNNYPRSRDHFNATYQESENQTTMMAPINLNFETTSPLPAKDTAQGTDHMIDSSVNSYEEFYRTFYGTEEGLNHLKKFYGPDGLQRARSKFGGVKKELDDVRSANEHFLRIRTRARCKVPSPQLVRVKDYYPDPSREYLPRCTLLHRCSDTSGCCDSDAFHCVPSAMQEVMLHFYTLTVGRNGLGYKSSKNNIERLLFVNHTACHCQPINDLPRIISLDRRPYPLDGTAPKEDEVPATSHHHHRHHDTTSKCRECPVPFNSRTYRDGRCGCDCFDRQKPCLKIKRGKEPLSEIERRCVEASYCHIPDCEYGIFDTSSGYCPRRHDEAPRDLHNMEAALRRSQSPQHRRWTFTERD